MTDGKRLIDEAREARVLSPELRTAKQARADKAALRSAQTERAGRVSPAVEGEGPGRIGDGNE